MPTSMPNAATILNAAHIGTGRHITGHCYHVTRFRVGRRSFPRLELSQATRVQLREPGKRRAGRQHLVPANKSQRSAAFSTMCEQRQKRVARSI